jgi:hypothetical protein
MAYEIKFENFYEAGIMQGGDGNRYSIWIERDLHPFREIEILKQILLGKLEIRGHIYRPKKKWRSGA